jgi:hypothetical protein
MGAYDAQREQDQRLEAALMLELAEFALALLEDEETGAVCDDLFLAGLL